MAEEVPSLVPQLRQSTAAPTPAGPVAAETPTFGGGRARHSPAAHLIRSDPAPPSLVPVSFAYPQHFLPPSTGPPPLAPAHPEYPCSFPASRPIYSDPHAYPHPPYPVFYVHPGNLSSSTPASDYFPSQYHPAVCPVAQPGFQSGYNSGFPSHVPGAGHSGRFSVVYSPVEPMAQPLSRTWEIPPRPKPGRKPAEETPANKRKAQNRIAQRAFRERKAQQLAEIRDDCQKREKELQQQVTQLIAENAELQQRCARAQKENSRLNDQLAANSQIVAQLSRQFSRPKPTYHPPDNAERNEPKRRQENSATGFLGLPPISPAFPQGSSSHSDPLIGCGSCGKDGRCECIEKILDAPEDATSRPNSGAENGLNDDMELDMTDFGKTTSKNPTMADDRDQPSIGTPLDDDCGFCTDATNCVCRAAAATANSAQPDPPSTTQNLLTPPDSAVGDEVRRFSIDKPQPMEPPSFARGPGTCPSCISDPERRRFCQALALVNPARPRPAISGGISNIAQEEKRIPALSEQGDNRVSCADAYTLLSNDPNFERNRSNPQFLERLRVEMPKVNRHCHSCKSQDCSSYEVDCISILAAMKQDPES